MRKVRERWYFWEAKVRPVFFWSLVILCYWLPWVTILLVGLSYCFPSDDFNPFIYLLLLLLGALFPMFYLRHKKVSPEKLFDWWRPWSVTQPSRKSVSQGIWESFAPYPQDLSYFRPDLHMDQAWNGSADWGIRDFFNGARV